MKVFIVGANGRVGKTLITELTNRGHSVTAGVRNPENFEINSNVDIVQFDLTAPVEQIAQKIAGSDAIYFVAGSRGKNLLQIDAFGSVKLQQAAERAGIKRFIQLSAIFATEPEQWDDPRLASLLNYQIAKFFADEWLINNSGLDYTILQPGALVEAESGTGLIQVGVQEALSNTIPNVAATLAEILDHDNTIGKVIPMGDGQTPISQALETL
ncbi:SDR family oxidoreductase [Alloscardovia theropitheci]|uniref:SDR family oxidoreductase n=1 Tax=Alloscardovia theropitheci TaxID=2496842 RepID=A0A4R0QZ89_9BIFI|nr:SDR family oxidoreductase [Alloscardovia theropitheci]TCD53906.1 SDR family oxidoreductase [Alloscardovia theropitheci]